MTAFHPAPGSAAAQPQAQASEPTGSGQNPVPGKSPPSVIVGKVEVVGGVGGGLSAKPDPLSNGSRPIGSRMKDNWQGTPNSIENHAEIAKIHAEISKNPAELTPPSTPLNPDFYQAAVLNAGIPVVSLDATGCILAWNSAAVRLFGRGEAEVLGRPLESLIPSEYRTLAAKAFQRTIQQRSVNIYEMSLVPQGGKNPTHVGVTLSCVIDSGGGLKGVMAWMRDISNRKELEAHLMRTRHMASVGTLAAGVAHHFNNIACGMGAMVEFALATEDTAAMLKALRMSAEACSRISYITQSMLACSGEASVEPGDEDLSDLTEELLRFADAVEPTLNQKGIHLQLDLQARRVTAVPRVRFGQALHHLLRNAEDAIGERSQLLGAAPFERRITIRTQSQGDQIMFQIADTGIGIDPDDMPLIFDPFFTKKGVQGGGNRNNPGLGLTLVHSVVMDMGGHIWADSTVNQGTTLHVLIPIVV